MKCPKCGCELENGKFYCSTCGTEIQYVPNYEPEIEDSIDTSINDISEHILQKKKKSVLFKVVIGIAFLCISMGIYGIIFYVNNNSFDYQYKQAVSYAEEENYKHALTALEKAIDLDPDNTDLILLKSKYYLLYGFRDTSKSILENAIQSGLGTLEVYETLIQMYIEDENVEAIVNLIKNSQNASIFEKYKVYIADPPILSSKSGTYFNEMYLKMLASDNGIIYYTLDGTIPTSSSLQYEEPLFLEEGIYEISAIFINDFGIQSEIVRNEYVIDLSRPYAPEVNVYSGVTSIPKAIVIEVQEDCEVLYTLDGSDITDESYHYSSPIAMPIGSFVLRCVTVNKDKEYSNETTRTIELIIPGEISAEDAISISFENLLDKGKISDLSGNATEHNGTYTYTTNSAFSYDGNPYYLIYEWYQEPDAIAKKTGNLFGVQMITGEFLNVAFDEEGNYRIY
jgi:tetratricopeptide (TPR) repeat protein